MSIADNISRVRDKISNSAIKANRDPSEVTLIAVTKTIEVPKIKQAIDAGIFDLGENRVQEMAAKCEQIEKNVAWHQIGYLQSNKVKYIIKQIELIHSLSTLSTAYEIDRQVGVYQRQVDCLVQVNVSGEDSKSGVDPENLSRFLEEISGLSRINIRGLMTIAPLSGGKYEAEKCFEGLRRIFENLKQCGYGSLSVLSMGMSGDYEEGIRQGATMVRIGSAIFAE